jgi:hypothetical protein
VLIGGVLPLGGFDDANPAIQRRGGVRMLLSDSFDLFAPCDPHMIMLPKWQQRVESFLAYNLLKIKAEIWGGWRDLNPRHPEPQSGATTN